MVMRRWSASKTVRESRTLKKLWINELLHLAEKKILTLTLQLLHHRLNEDVESTTGLDTLA